jgi:hypothetical protein
MRVPIKPIVVAALAAAATGGVMAATGQAGSTAKTTKFYTLRPGSYVRFIGIDLSCSYETTDPDHHEPGPFLYCSRYSTATNKTLVSRSLGVSNYHYKISNASSSYWATTFNRSP